MTRQAYAHTYRRHRFAVYERCLSLLRDASEAQDATHEVFLQLLARPDAFLGRASLSTYLYSVATHECLDRLRNLRARQGDWARAASEHIALLVARPDLEAATHAKRVVETLLSSTDETTALIVVYHFVDGLSQGEIAELVGLSRSTVNERVQQLRAHPLREVTP